MTRLVCASRTPPPWAGTWSTARALFIALLLAGACTDTRPPPAARGLGLQAANLPATVQAHIYEAAERSAFDVDNTSLLLDRRTLPRETGLAPGASIGSDVVVEMRRRGAIRGICEPPLQGTVGTAHCTANTPGYVVRFSPVLQMGTDSVEVYLYAQKYDTPSSGISETLRFERAYQVLKHGSDWQVATEGRVPDEVRGAKR